MGICAWHTGEIVRMIRERSVGIFRLQLFKPSETFIPSQVKQLVRYSPTYVGKRMFGSSGSAEVVLPKFATQVGRALDKMTMSVLRNPAPFISALGHRHLNLIHAHFGVDGVFALPLARRLGIPMITTLHGFDVTRSDGNMLRSASPSLINGVLFRRQLQREGSLFICVSEFIRRAAIARGYPDERMHVNYIGIDCKMLQLRGWAAEDDSLIVQVGRLVEVKGTSYLLKAMGRIKDSCAKARLVVIGDGPLRSALEAEVRHLRLEDRVRFLGVQPHAEVLKWVARAAVMVVPSITAANGDEEGFGMVNIEASAQGVPVVAFNSGGIGEAIIDGQTGLLAPERDVHSLASCIESLLQDRELRQILGSNGRRRVEKHFDIRVQTDRLEHIYDQVTVGKQ